MLGNQKYKSDQNASKSIVRSRRKSSTPNNRGGGPGTFKNNDRLLRCKCPQVLIVDDNDFNILSLQTILEFEYNIKIESVINITF